MSETPVRLVKAGKLDGLFTSPGGENKRLIAACIDSSPPLLERVGSSGASDPKAQNVRLTAAGMETLAENLPIADVEHAVSKAAGFYRTAFKAACVKATRRRLAQLADKQRQLIADARQLLDHANQDIVQQISALNSERTHAEAIEKQLGAAIATARPARLEPTDTRDFDFLRSAAQLLIFAWQDAVSPDVRTALEGVFGGLGIRHVYRCGEIVSFDGRHHDTLDAVDIGDQVVVEQPGWALKTHRGTVMLTKSAVSRSPTVAAPNPNNTSNAPPPQG
jgi:hypothetical protein